MSETQCDNKIYGKDIPNIYENNSGKNIPFGQMDILPVVQEMYRKKCGRDIQKIKVEKEGDSGC